MYGFKYTLHKVWNVPQFLWERYTARDTANFITPEEKMQRSEGFLMVDLDGTTATCEMHGYRAGQGKIWEVAVPAAIQ
jgi:hypothetical protein